MKAQSRWQDHRRAQAPQPAFATLVVLAALSARLGAAPEVTGPPAEPVTAASLDKLIREKRYVDLRAALSAKTPLTPKTILTPNERDYFQGVLDNHTNAVDASAHLLERVIPGLRRNGQAERLRTAMRTLADDYGKRFEYGPAADTYRTLDRDGGAALGEAERREIRDDADLYDVLRGQRRQTVAFGKDVDTPTNIQARRDPLGLLEAPVSSETGQAESWVVDTGANISTVTRSTAERMHLRILSGKATVRGIGGAEVLMQVAVIPVLRLGGATVHDAAVLVLDDKALNVGRPAYQIRGILGFPVIAALGRVTFGPHGGITLGGRVPDADPPDLYMEGLTPLIAAGTQDGTRLFTLDTGADASMLSARYWREHQTDLQDAAPITYRFMGADGVKSLTARQAPQVTLRIGRAVATLAGLPVLVGPSGNATNDAFYGNLGQDLLKPFTSYTLDFRSMQFTLQR